MGKGRRPLTAPGFGLRPSSAASPCSSPGESPPRGWAAPPQQPREPGLAGRGSVLCPGLAPVPGAGRGRAGAEARRAGGGRAVQSRAPRSCQPSGHLRGRAQPPARRPRPPVSLRIAVIRLDFILFFIFNFFISKGRSAEPSWKMNQNV